MMKQGGISEVARIVEILQEDNKDKGVEGNAKSIVDGEM